MQGAAYPIIIIGWNQVYWLTDDWFINFCVSLGINQVITY